MISFGNPIRFLENQRCFGAFASILVHKVNKEKVSQIVCLRSDRCYQMPKSDTMNLIENQRSFGAFAPILVHKVSTKLMCINLVTDLSNLSLNRCKRRPESDQNTCFRALHRYHKMNK